MTTVRRRVWEIVEVARAGDRASRRFDVAILTLIVVNTLAVILATVHGLASRAEGAFFWVEAVSIPVFSVEYLARLWTCVEDPRFADPLGGRLRFALRPMPVVDLLAILPSLLLLSGIDLRFLRILRLARMARVAKAGRYLAALAVLRQVLRSRREHLLILGAAMLALLVIASSLIYWAENPAQPETFSSIPAAMWWSVSTLTTVGYGDVYPVTGLGKLLASVVALLGVALFALPAGILGSGFVEALDARRSPQRCPHCGEPLNSSTPLPPASDEG